MKYELLKNIIKANKELVEDHNEIFVINPICYYLVIEYIAQESGNSFADLVAAFEELGIETLNTKVNNFFCSKRKDYEPDLDSSDLFNYRVQKMTEIRNSQEGMETELALFDVYEDNYRSYIVARAIIEQNKRSPQVVMNSDNIKFDFSRTNIWLGILKASIIIRLPEDSKYKDMSIVKAQKEIAEDFIEQEGGITDLNKCAIGSLKYDALTFLNRATVALGNSNSQK